MTVQAGPAGEERHDSLIRDPRLWLGAGILLLIALAILAAVYLVNRGPSLAAIKLPPPPSMQAAGGFVRGDVSSVSGATFSIATGSGPVQMITVAPGTRVEALVRATPDSIAVGDYLTVGGVPNQVYSFAVKLVVDIPAVEAAGSTSGAPKSKGGFTGWETYTDPNQQPSVYGRVESIDADGFHLNGALGPIIVRLDANSPLRRLTVGGIDLVHGGDHVALPATTATTPAVMLSFGEH